MLYSLCNILFLILPPTLASSRTHFLFKRIFNRVDSAFREQVCFGPAGLGSARVQRIRLPSDKHAPFDRRHAPPSVQIASDPPPTARCLRHYCIPQRGALYPYAHNLLGFGDKSRRFAKRIRVRNQASRSKAFFVENSFS